MARLFSIAIPFDGTDHTALVTIRQQGCDLVCMVRFADENLHSILPGANLVFGLLEGLKEPAVLPNKQAENLVKTTISAIENHLQASAAAA